MVDPGAGEVEIADGWRTAGCATVVPRTPSTRRGHPVGFSCQLRGELLTLTGDVGARLLIDKYSNQLYTFKTNEEVVLRDIDIPLDLIKEDK